MLRRGNELPPRRAVAARTSASNQESAPKEAAVPEQKQPRPVKSPALAAVLRLVCDDRVLRLFPLCRSSGDFVFEGEILALKHRCYLGGLHAVVFRHGECKRLE